MFFEHNTREKERNQSEKYIKYKVKFQKKTNLENMFWKRFSSIELRNKGISN